MQRKKISRKFYKIKIRLFRPKESPAQLNKKIHAKACTIEISKHRSK